MTQPTRRLFFALWPDEATRRGIVQRRDGVLGALSRRRVPDRNLHLTVLFLGDQPADRLGDIESLGGKVRSPGFELVLDRFGWFSGARVVWLGGEAPAAGRDLARVLAEAAQARDLRFDARPWRPHVTLFRRVDRRPRLLRPEPLSWPVADFSLVESVPGNPYQVLRSWPLE